VLQSIGFYASPAPGSWIEKKGYDGNGILICDVPDPEAFLRDRLGEKNLVLDGIDQILPLRPDEIDQLPPQLKDQFHRRGWCMVFRQYQSPPEE
jgi:hypothetical protein